MLDIRFILHHPDLVRQSIIRRGVSCDLDSLIETCQTLKKIRGLGDLTREQININQQLIRRSSDEAERHHLIEDNRSLKEQNERYKKEITRLEKIFDEHMLTVPNILPEDTPPGSDDSCNREVYRFIPQGIPLRSSRSHVELARSLDLIDFEAGVRTAGQKFYFLKNELVMLDLAIQMFCISKLVSRGYTPLATPDLAKEQIIRGSGFNPRGGNRDIYHLEGTDLDLIATSEITIGGMLSEQIFDHSDLPLRYCAVSHCFRPETGSVGSKAFGLYRVHQFSKVEIYLVSLPEYSEAALEEILEIQKEIYCDLELPYRVMRICAGDLGAPAFKKYDLEAWMPGKGHDGGFGEITSASNNTDFQARRLNIRYLDEKRKKHYVHTLNGTASATGRTMLAILENNQQDDGSIRIPDALLPYMNGIKEIR